MDIYKEEDFYKDNSWPTEHFFYCDYYLNIIPQEEYGADYDQFALVTNALYPYIRLTKKRSMWHYPCGLCDTVAPENSYAKMTESERDEECPKIAWGVAAVFLSSVRYDKNQDDYVPIKTISKLLQEYYDKYWGIYMSSHNSLKFSKLSIEQKELGFIDEHKSIIKSLWEKTVHLKKYPVLYRYASDVEKQYEEYLEGRKQSIEYMLMKRNNRFSTEVKEVSDNPYVKVFFLDDTVAPSAKAVIDKLNSVRKVNITESKSKAHPGNTLTVYPKPMVDANECEREISIALKLFFSNVTIGNMQPHNEAYFAGIEKRILDLLDKAISTIIVCVAWFTNPKLRDKLLEKQAEGIDVRVIIYKDGVNHNKGVDLTGLKHKECRSEKGGIMHEKFCVIDNVHTISGSYNWTMNAENRNDEDAAFQLEDYKFASKFTREFNDKWNKDE